MYHLKCVICLSRFISPIVRDCCSLNCSHLLEHLEEKERFLRRMASGNTFCPSCVCEGYRCLNKNMHMTHWTAERVNIPVPQVKIVKECNQEHVKYVPVKESNEMQDKVLEAMKDLADNVKSAVAQVKDAASAQIKEKEKPVMEIKKVVPKESATLLGLGLAAGIVIKAYFLWTFAAGAAAAYAYKVWSENQKK